MTAAAGSTYKYRERLAGRSIRLLRLEKEAESGDDVIRCSLEHHPLDGDVQFFALSYVWGQNQGLPSSQIVCDGQACIVGHNLFQALEHLRIKWGQVAIWIDALCINQGDTEEKTEQVRMMRDIYDRASLVIVWLGRGTDRDILGWQFAERLWAARKYHDEEVPLSINGLRLSSLHRLSADTLAIPQELLNNHDEEWAALAALLSREWFTRVWVIQELLVARQAVFLCGLTKIDANLLLYPAYAAKVNTSVKTRLSMTEGNIDDPKRAAANLAGLYFMAGPHGKHNFRLVTLLDTTRNSRATDLRDKVFALVGLTQDTSRDIISYGLTEEEAVTGLQEGILQTDISLNALARVDVSSLRSRAKLPSWVPNWTRPDCQVKIMDEIVRSIEENTAYTPRDGRAIRAEYRTQVQIQNRVLTAAGTIADRIQSVITSDLFFYEGRPVFDIFHRFYTWVHHLRELTRGLAGYPTGGDSPGEAIWRSLIGPMEEIAESKAVFGGAVDDWMRGCVHAYLDCLRTTGSSSSSHKEHRDKLSEQEQGWLERMETDTKFRNEAAGLYSAEHVQRFVRALQIIAAGRRFCRTERGYLGWVHPDAAVGDKVVALRGTRILFVTRPAAACQGAHHPQGDEPEGVESTSETLVGAAWLYGLMNGEPLGFDLPETEFKFV